MKFIIFATTSWNLYNSRLGLGKALKQHQQEVIFLAPHDEYSAALTEEGLNWVDLPLHPRGKNIFQELHTIFYLISYYKREKPDIAHNFTPKGVIYGSIAAKIAGVPKIINTITGLGFVFSGNASKALKNLVIVLYRIALRNTKVIFQNKDNYIYFTSHRFTNKAQSTQIPGSGIDMERFSPSPEPDDSPPVVLLPSRFVEEKGIRTLVEASRIIKERDVRVRVVLVGKPEEDQPTAIRPEELSEWVNEGVVEWWGWHSQMEKIYPLAHIVCLPTYYMEGIPKSLIEAAACARPIITTNLPGCREVVHHGENGYLIPPKDPQALAEVIIKLVEDSELRKQMGQKSRELAANEFSMEIVLREYFEHYGLSFEVTEEHSSKGK